MSLEDYIPEEIIIIIIVTILVLAAHTYFTTTYCFGFNLTHECLKTNLIYGGILP